jgi:methyl-accepting chemotaxis protein
MRSQMTIGKKLLMSFGAMLALTVVVSVVSLLGSSSLGAQVGSITKVEARKQFLAGEINTVTSDFIAEERGILVRGLLKEQAKMDEYNQDFRDSSALLKKRVDELALLAETADGRRLVAELQNNFDSISQIHEKVYRLASSGQMDGAVQMVKDTLMPLALQMSTAGERTVTLQQDMLEKAAKSAESSVSRTRWTTIFMIGLSLLVGVSVVYVVRQINSGLRQAVAELGEGGKQTASAASQVAASSQSLAQGASEQAASIEETSASSEEINSMARKNSENSQAGAAEMVKAAQLVADANARLEQMAASMKDITDSSQKISKIIKVIDEIAFQTNILALNAAVEAARAGEAGMGFAVVAEEVRNLAQRSAQAAKDTATLIEESIEKSTIGSRNLDMVAEGIKTITASTTRVKTLVDEVNLGGHEQARGIEQISKAIIQMEQVTQKAAANAEESAAAAEELNAQSETLENVVERLAAMVGGGDTEAGNGNYAGSGRKRAETSRHAAGLSALRAAVTHKPANGHAAEPVLVGAKTHKHAFPLDEEFEEL